MSFVDERERGFEAKFAHDEAQEFRAIARRNQKLGVWAAERMGLENGEEYAAAIVKTHVDQSGAEGVLRKLTQDFTGAGLTIPTYEIAGKMDEFLAVSREELKTGL